VQVRSVHDVGVHEPDRAHARPERVEHVQ
jgi:hypothetical protein